LKEKQGLIPEAIAWARQSVQALEATEDQKLAERIRGWIAAWEMEAS